MAPPQPSLSALTYPWIPVRHLDGTTTRLGITDTLKHADRIADLDITARVERAAMLRLLAALNNQTLNPDEYRIDQFMQAPGLGTDVAAPAALRLHESSTSRPLYGETLTPTIPLDEALRSLVTFQAFARSGKVPGGQGASAKAAATYDSVWLPIGETLADTLRMLAGPETPGDLFGWQHPEWPGKAEVRPQGWRHVYTWQSRQVVLELDNETCVGVRLAPGHNPKGGIPFGLDPCIAHKLDSEKAPRPYRPTGAKILEGLSVLSAGRFLPAAGEAKSGLVVAPRITEHANDDRLAGFETVTILVTQVAVDHVIEDAINAATFHQAAAYTPVIDIAEELLKRAQKVLAAARNPTLGRQGKDGRRSNLFYARTDVSALQHRLERHIRAAIATQTPADEATAGVLLETRRFVDETLAQAHPTVWELTAVPYRALMKFIHDRTPKPETGTESEVAA